MRMRACLSQRFWRTWAIASYERASCSHAVVTILGVIGLRRSIELRCCHLTVAAKKRLRVNIMVLQGGVICLTSAAILTRSDISIHAARFDTPLPIPQLIDARANSNAVSLIVGQRVHAYRPGRSVQSFGYSSPVLGPVIRLARGQSTDITIENKLGRPTTVHWHGLVIPGEVDGGPHNTIAAGVLSAVSD